MKIAVYCGSDYGNDPDFRLAAARLGSWIGAKGLTLVYGGGDSGLMGITARAVYEAGCPVIGVIPEDVAFIAGRPQPFVTDLITAADMSTRKQKMLSLADAFIALPGGIGTLDEISEAATLTKIGVFHKKCVLFNHKGFYEPLREMFRSMEKAGFLKEADMGHILFSDYTQEIEDFLLR